MKLRFLSSLRHRNYMLLWVGTLISHSGDWMDNVALNWLILVMTNSPFYLGVFNLCRALPMLVLVLIGGVVVDRMDRRKILMVTQTAAMVLAFALAVLVSTGLVQVWHIFLLGTLRGIINSFNMPARQAIISDLVPRHDLANAIALNSATMNVTRIWGPAIAGILIAFVGVSSPFYVNGLSFLGVLYTLQAMVLPERTDRPARTSMSSEMKEGLTYIRGNSTILTLVIIAVVPMFLAQPYTNMLTVFAKDVLDIGPLGLGMLTSAAAVGAVTGALVVASLGDFRHKGALMMGALFVFGLTLFIFSMSPWPVVSILVVVVVGACSTAYNASNNTILQLMSPDNLRGRIMSTLFLNRAMVPMGTATIGALASVIGAPLAMGGAAALVAILAVVIRVVAPQVAALE
ncbi:MAG: MFS transporter [Dehalococcoidia bacterium]|nr:MFS transporter [Dehalococcoidia bacterium]